RPLSPEPTLPCMSPPACSSRSPAPDPTGLGRVSAKGTPTLALLVSSYGIVVALALERWAAANAFVYILRGALFGMMLSWIISLAAHISFRRRLSSAEVAALPTRSPLGRGGSVVGLTEVEPDAGDPAARRVDSAVRQGVAGDGRDGGGVAVERESGSDRGQRGRAETVVRTALGRSGVAGPLRGWSDLRGASRPVRRGRGRGR